MKEAGFYGLIHTGIRVKAGVAINITAVPDAFLHERVNVPLMKPCCWVRSALANCSA